MPPSDAQPRAGQLRLHLWRVLSALAARHTGRILQLEERLAEAEEPHYPRRGCELPRRAGVGQYVYRVRACHQFGCSPWAAADRRDLPAPADAPISPWKADENNIPIWHGRRSRATGYNVEVSEDMDFDNADLRRRGAAAWHPAAGRADRHARVRHEPGRRGAVEQRRAHRVRRPRPTGSGDGLREPRPRNAGMGLGRRPHPLPAGVAPDAEPDYEMIWRAGCAVRAYRPARGRSGAALPRAGGTAGVESAWVGGGERAGCAACPAPRPA